MKKVLYVSPNGYLGGAERFVLTAVSTHAKGRNIDASILFFSDGEACNEARELGLEVYLLKQNFRFRQPWNLLKAILEIRSIVKKLKPDILHLTMPYSHITLSIATIGLKIKKVWFQHGPVGSYLDRLANLFTVDAILYNSNDLLRKHHNTWPSTTGVFKELIIQLGVSNTSSKSALFQSKEIALGAAGRICVGKGYHNILSALGNLKAKGTLRPFKFYIAGSAKNSVDKKYQQQLHALIKKYELTNEVVFLDHQQNMEPFYHKLDIFVHAAILDEGFGLVIAEAMLNGCLVIGPNSGGVTDLLKNDKNGICFSSVSDTAILELQKILGLFLNSNENFSLEKYQAMATNGKEYIEKNYSVKNMNDQLEKFYLEL